MRGSASAARAIAIQLALALAQAAPRSPNRVWYPSGQPSMNESARASLEAAITCASLASGRP